MIVDSGAGNGENVKAGDPVKFWQPPTRKRSGGWSYGVFVSVYANIAKVRRYGDSRVTEVPISDVEPRNIKEEEKSA